MHLPQSFGKERIAIERFIRKESSKNPACEAFGLELLIRDHVKENGGKCPVAVEELVAKQLIENYCADVLTYHQDVEVTFYMRQSGRCSTGRHSS